jgi:imidazolonepropionase-like amidohydrolase
MAPITMTRLTALRAITSVAAGVCGLGHRKGRVAPGFDADILAVDGTRSPGRTPCTASARSTLAASR